MNRCMLLLNIVNQACSLKRKTTLVLIMLSILTGMFSGSAHAEKNKLHSRQIKLSGNVFHFAMPEDFSKDMPADEMVEALDISDISKFDTPEYGNLIRRWWDIKKPGWFGKNLGTVMMDISVQKVVSNQRKLIHDRPYNIQDRMDFMLMLDDSFHQRYGQLNREIYSPDRAVAYHSSFVTMVGDKIETNYREFNFNQQKWIENGIVGPRSDLIIILAIPIDEQVYLEASFTYSKNDDVLLRDFRSAGFDKMANIQQSFIIDYAERNPFKKIVGGVWLEKTNDDVLIRHRDALFNLLTSSEARTINKGSRSQGALGSERVDTPSSQD
jgi:hypothetical protein